MPDFTIIADGRSHIVDATSDGDSVRVAPSAIAAALGWELKPQGYCKADLCYPIPPGSTIASDAGIDLAAFADVIGHPLALDLSERAAALGVPAAARAETLASLIAPDFTLPDLDGRQFSLSDFRQKKVLLAAYGSW